LTSAKEGHFKAKSYERLLRLYNAVTDKGTAYCSQRWPVQPQAALRDWSITGENRIEKAVDLLNQDAVDYVIFTFFNLRWDTYYWPPRKEMIKQNRNAFRNTLTKIAPGSVRNETLFFDVVYLDKENISGADQELLNLPEGPLN